MLRYSPQNSSTVDALYEKHLGNADMHGVVKRYVLNERLGDWIAGLTALYCAAFVILIGTQAFSHWPFGIGWKLPHVSAWLFIVAAFLCMFTFDRAVTFGPSPWGTEQGSRTTRFFRELRFLQGGVASWVCLIGFLILLEGLSDSDVLKSAGGFATIDVALLLMFFAPVNPYWSGLRPRDWLKFLFFSWLFLTLGLHYPRPHYAWGIAAVLCLKLAAALALIPLVIIGFLWAVRFMALRFVVQLVRLWRSAERIADEQGRKS